MGGSGDWGVVCIRWWRRYRLGWGCWRSLDGRFESSLVEHCESSVCEMAWVEGRRERVLMFYPTRAESCKLQFDKLPCRWYQAIEQTKM
jgi:hypothetical protein